MLRKEKDGLVLFDWVHSSEGWQEHGFGLAKWQEHRGVQEAGSDWEGWRLGGSMRLGSAARWREVEVECGDAAGLVRGMRV